MKTLLMQKNEKNFNRGLRGWTRIMTLKEVVSICGCLNIHKRLGHSTRASASPFIFDHLGWRQSDFCKLASLCFYGPH